MKNGVYIIVLFLILSSCMDDDAWYNLNEDSNLPGKELLKQAGLFIINEGNFMYDNASVSYYSIDSMKISNEVFYKVNKVPVGDVAQSMTIRDSLGYIVVNNSSKIYIINVNTFEYLGKITGLTSPRYIHLISAEKAYVSDLYASAIAIVNPVTMKVTGFIDVHNNTSAFQQHSTEQMIQIGKEVFTNCWSYDNKILVIDTESDRLVDSITVSIQPNSMVLDKDQKLWVLCDGGFDGNPYGYGKPALVRVDPETRSAETILEFAMEDNPHDLVINGTGDTLYYLNRHVYSMPVTAATSPRIKIESSYGQTLVGGYYALTVDPYYGDIYVADAIDQVQFGKVYRYSSGGQLLDILSVGINPGAFCFKEKK